MNFLSVRRETRFISRC